MRGSGGFAARVLKYVLSFVLATGPVLADAAPAFASPAASEAAAQSPSEPTIVRELKDKRTETSREYLLSDGIFRAEYFSHPIHFENPATGAFERIDPTLTAAEVAGRQVAVNRKAGFRIQLPDTLTGDWVSVEEGGASVSMRPAASADKGAAAPTKGDVNARSVEATGRVYPDAFAGASLSYESLPDGLKETIIVEQPSAGSTYGFDLRLERLTPRPEADGSISLLASAEATTPTFTIPAPVMWDSCATTDAPAPADAVRYELSGSGSSYHLAVVADPSWMTDPARVYPVMIDPTVRTVSATPLDTYVSSRGGYQSTNYSGSSLLWVNTNDPNENWTELGLVQPGTALVSDMAGSKAAGRVVVAGRMKYYLHQIKQPGSITGKRCTSAVTISSVNWTTRPSFTEADNTPAVTPGAQGFYTFDVTDMTRYWQEQGSAANMCTARLSITSGDHIGFRSAEYSGTSYDPKWEIDYARQPRVTLTAPAGEDVTEIPDVAWDYAESDPYDNPQVEYEIEVRDAPGGTLLASSSTLGDDTEAQPPVPAAGWVPETTYYVRVRAASSPSTQVPRLWSEWSEYGSFTPLLPVHVTSLAATATAGQAWFAEGDTNGDGLNDLANDSATQGRGSVELSWEATQGATGYGIYLFDGGAYRKVDETTETTWTSAGATFYPTDTQIAALADSTTESPFRTSDGVGLRDDPRALYAKTAGASMDATAAYVFRVVPQNDFGSPDVADAPHVLVALDNRTLGVNDEVRHTTATMEDDMLGHSAEAVLDEGAVELSITDLAISSWGPEAALSRHYDSNVTSATTFAPGWRFSFEQAIETSTATFIDAQGERHRFYLRDGTYYGPDGFRATLTREFVDSELGYRLTYQGGDSALFDSGGQLVSESDANGNTVAYERSTPGELSIWAANGQRIVVGFDGSGCVTSATYATPAGTREITYSADTATVHYFPETQDAYDIAYAYSAGRLAYIAVPDYMGPAQQLAEYFGFGSSIDAQYVIGYDASGRLHTWQANRAGDGASPTQESKIAYAGSTATVYMYGQETAGPAGDGAVYTWNPTGSTALSTNAERTGTWTYAYDPSDDCTTERAPMGSVTTRTYDAAGNVTAETSDGRTTCYVYEADRVVEETSPKGAKTYSTYDADGNLTSEERVLNTEGERAVTEYSHNASGTVTQQRVKVSTTTWAVTDYADFAGNGEPQTTTQQDVKLSVDGDPVDLVSTCVYDAFGNQVSAKDASGRWTARQNSYTISGRLRASETVTGTVTRYSYYRTGRTYETSTTAGADVVNWSCALLDARGVPYYQGVFDADGEFGPMEILDSDGAGNIWRTTYAPDPAHEDGVSRNSYDYSSQLLWSLERGVEDTEANRLRLVYDAEGRETQRIEPGETSPTITTYSVAGDVLRTDEPDGTWVELTYDADGNEVMQLSPTESGEATTTSVYDLGGRLVESIDENGVSTTYAYDLAGNQLGAGIGGQSGSTTVVNTAGWVLSKTDADGLTTKTTFDAAGRALETDVAGKVTTHAYDGAGRQTSETSPDGTVHTDYDAFSRVVRAWQTQGETTIKDARATYDEYSRVRETSETVGAVTKHRSYGETDRLVEATDSYFGTSSEAAYSARGLETARDVDADSVSFARTVGSRDAAGRPLSATITGLSASTTSYGPGGRVAAQGGLGFAGSGAAYTYGDAGRKTSESLALGYPDTTFTGAYGYTKDGRLASAVIDGATTTYGYDSGSGSVTGYRPSGEPTATLSYDAKGRIKRADATYFAHDATGHRTSAGSQPQASVSTDAFDRADGALASPWSRVNGELDVSVVSNAAQAPSPATLTELWYLDSAAATRTDMSVRFRVSELDAGSGRAFSPIARLVPNVGFYFAVLDGDSAAHLYKIYNNECTLIAAGSLLTTLGRNLEADDVVALDAFGSGLTLTVNGVVVNSATDTSIGDAGYPGFRCAAMAGGAIRFDDYSTHSASSVLVPATELTWSADRLAGLASDDASATYTYDAAGQRTSAVIREGSLTTTMTYTYDGLKLLHLAATRSDDATYSLTYLCDEADRPISAIYDASDADPALVHFVTTDRGDVVELLDASGSPFATYRYDAWGNPLAAGTQTRSTGQITAALAAAIATRQPLRYAGYAYDDWSDLYYCSQRYYDPATFAFISKDPARADREESAYQYCGGDPVGSVDPTGLWKWLGRQVPAVRQGSANWCWAACCEAVLEYYGAPKTTNQRQLVYNLFGKVVDKAATALQVKGTLEEAGSDLGIKPRVWSYALRPQHLTARLRRGKPIIFGLTKSVRGGDIGHMVVVERISDHRTPSARYIEFMDPATRAHVKKKYREFKEGEYQGWTVNESITTA